MTPNRLNEQGRDMLLGETEKMRKEVISFAHQAIKLYSGIDKRGNNEDGPIELFILAEALERPELEGRMSLTLRLEPSIIRAPVESDPTQSLTILYPIPDELDFTAPDFDPEELPIPDVVYFVRELDGLKSYFAVVREVAFDYVPVYTFPDQNRLPESGQEINFILDGLTVQSGLPILAELLEDLINMKGVLQRKVSPGEFVTEE